MWSRFLLRCCLKDRFNTWKSAATRVDIFNIEHYLAGYGVTFFLAGGKSMEIYDGVFRAFTAGVIPYNARLVIRLYVMALLL